MPDHLTLDQRIDEAATSFFLVSRTADQEADRLLQLGFLPGHDIILELRSIASRGTNECNRLGKWAQALTEAEEAADAGT